MELYLRRLWIARKWSNDMIRSTEDSTAVNPWMKNSWAKQALAEISGASNKKILPMVGREAHVRHGQHGKEVVHGLMQGGLCLDDKKDGAVSQNSKKIYAADGDRDPDVCIFQPWHPNQEEGGDFNIRFVSNRHDAFRGLYTMKQRFLS